MVIFIQWGKKYVITSKLKNISKENKQNAITLLYTKTLNEKIK